MKGRRRGSSEHPRPDAVRAWPEVLREELADLGGPGLPVGSTIEDVHRAIHALPDGERRVALCLSGGGIRSATLSLGVLQGLARLGILARVHYLSTVSGGGYIGSWLTAWIHRVGAATVFQQLGATRKPPATPEPPEIGHLRSYSNYLNPRVGWLSADTWTLVATYLRNVLLNWAVFIPILLAALAVPRVIVALANLDLAGAAMFRPAWWPWLGLALALVAAVYAGVYQFAGARDDRDRWTAAAVGQRGFIGLCLLPLAGAALAFTTFVAWRSNTGPLRWPITWLQEHGVVPDGPVSEWADVYAAFAVPVALAAVLLTVALYVGFSSRFHWSSDDDLEWWSRAGAWVFIVVASWLVVSVLVLFGPVLVLWIWDERGRVLKTAVAAAGLVSGAISLFGGSSGKTSPGGAAGGKARTGAGSVVDVATLIAAPTFLVFVIVGLSMLTNLLLGVLGTALNRYPLGLDWGDTLLAPASWHESIVFEAPLGLLLAFIVLATATGVVMAWFVNVNRFSLHAMYRNRLIRGYLGASNPARQPDPFTGFDAGDNLQMYEVTTRQPLHVVNIALNLVGGGQLAWQERKAEAFTVTRLHCGTRFLGYRASKFYGSNRRDRLGISLGTAMAISGAAASPNMGYHSSPAVTFLMTLFNARLGWWLGNPGRAGERTHRRWGPAFALGPILTEMFGLTDERSPYVYLSDGGHFDNLGLYEMVARRCGTIIVVDAGCDPGYVFEDLGNAIRKIRVDFGIPIDVTPAIQHRPPAAVAGAADTAPSAGQYVAVGTIHYGVVDDGARDGTLLYIKPCICGGEPADVANYAAGNAAFPHETTNDQWFSESQFESYRALGQHIVTTAVAPLRPTLGL